MRKVDKYKNVNDESFKRVLGVKRSTYEVLLVIYLNNLHLYNRVKYINFL